MHCFLRAARGAILGHYVSSARFNPAAHVPTRKEACMAIIGAHMILYSSKADELRNTLRDTFGFKFVDAHGGWLIFALPPAELAVHPADASGPEHQISFMCDDLRSTMADLRKKGVQFEGEPHKESWGTAVDMVLPGGVKVIVYEPRHALAITPAKSSTR
jgi:catechol 2,3-dioxygenase-like lactoylglutathione lyase family enzyme